MNDLVPRLAISTAAVIGLLALIWLLWNKTENTLSHVRRLLIVSSLFFAARCLDWTARVGFFRTLTVASAALVPLMVLLVIESFMRQHAPRWVKLFVAGGGCGFALLSINAALTRQNIFTNSLAIYQITAFAVLVYLILSRDRTFISNQENTNIGRISLILIVMVPLLASDYELFPEPIPRMMSGVAVLIGCWVLMNLHLRELDRTRMAIELIFLCVFAYSASWFVAWHLSLDITRALEIWAMLFAFTVAGSVIVNAMHQRWRSGPLGSVTQGLTQSQSLQSYLQGLKQRNLGCEILNYHDLIDFNSDCLLSAFHADGAIDINGLPQNSSSDSMGQSQMRTLLQRYGGTQAYLVARNPLYIAIGQSSKITEGFDAELLAAFGLSRLIAERDELRSR